MFESANPELLHKIAGVIAEHDCKDVKEWMQKSPWYREFELGREAERQLRREREWERQNRFAYNAEILLRISAFFYC